MEYLLGIHTFKARSPDELTVERGDYIEVLEDDSDFNDSWYCGRNLTSFKMGLFPKAFTTAVASLPADVLLRVKSFDEKAKTAELTQPLSPISNQPPQGNPTAQQQAQHAAQSAFANSMNSPLQSPRVSSPMSSPNTSVNLPPIERLNVSRTPSVQVQQTGPPSPQSVLSWTPQQVEAYFMSKGLTDEAPKFNLQRVTGTVLVEMDRETLKEIDIQGFGPRFEIEREIKLLRQAANLPPQKGNTDSPTSPQSGYASSMNSLVSTPVVQQSPYQNYFGYQQSAAGSAVTLNGYAPQPQQMYQPQRSASGSRSPPVQQYGYGPQYSQSAAYLPKYQYPYGQYPQQAQYQQSQPHLQQVPQTQQAVPLNQQQPMTQQPQPLQPQQPQQQQQQQPPLHVDTNQRQLPPQQTSEQVSVPRQKQHDVPSNGTQPIPIEKHTSMNSSSSHGGEEMTGSLTSNFSVQKGHHRHTSSMSRYSTNTHQRQQTLDDWESSVLEPTASETNLTSPSKYSLRNHQRNISNMSASSRHSTVNTVPTHTRSTSTDSTKQKRRSSIFSRLSGSPRRSTFEILPKEVTDTPAQSIHSPSISSPSTVVTGADSPQTQSSSQKRTSSENSTFSKLRPTMQKTKTSAFQEGIKHVTAEQARATAQKAGWMHKRGGTGGTGIGVWSKRYFTLHNTRLSYFSSFKDTKEKGLIDITGYRMIPIKDHELLVSLTAAGMGAGRHCFKLVPPGPGYKKGVAFTAPKVHYFAVETPEELREWQEAIMSATIERDESTPVVSTYQLPTISLPKAQELMAERLKTKGDIGSLTKE